MIKVAEWGTGMMGQGLLGFILDRPKDIDLVGVIVTNPAKEGKTVGELLDRPCDVKMTTDFEAVLAKKPDVVCINTQSNLDEVEPQILPALKAGCNVICIAEKISYPWASDPERAELFDKVAKENGVSILGTGINPGFVLDALIVMWSSICLRVDSVESLAPSTTSRRSARPSWSAGRRHHRRAVREGRRRRQHRRPLGFPESIELIAKALNWKIDEIVETREPSSPRSSAPRRTCTSRPAGSRAASRSARATATGAKIHLIHPQQIHPEMADQGTGDYIKIVGDPNVNMVNSPKSRGAKGTYASTGNYIPLMKDAKPGMLTVVDMPLPRFWTPTV